MNTRMVVVIVGGLVGASIGSSVIFAASTASARPLEVTPQEARVIVAQPLLTIQQPHGSLSVSGQPASPLCAGYHVQRSQKYILEGSCQPLGEVSR